MAQAGTAATRLKRVFISNRGEIAIRIARAASGLGMESVAIYAAADKFGLHTSFATRAVEVGGGGSNTSDPVGAYLDAPALIQAAKAAGCDCVHPGYGFLAENAAFAEMCAATGLTFVGPSPEALSLFGDKVRARAFASSLGIPVVPGSNGALATADEALAVAGELGYPVMLKASAGGGGRGMRLVERPAEMADAFLRCRGEATAAFGDGSLFLEKVIVRPRHIEVQILGDAQGNVVHLHERDCSVQQRNQKVIEIAPAPGLDQALRERIQADAIKLARAAAYVNAGTVEFLVAPEQGEYWFIECNPRVQVEHTVTEQVTGVDIVEAQFQLAAGASLASLGLGDQDAVGSPRGFAVQARVVATAPGTITAYKEPSGPGVRVDGCGYVGYAPPPQFDPLLAKVIGASNSTGSFVSAVERTLRALDEFHIAGLPANVGHLRAMLLHPLVRAGDARTTFLGEHPELAGGPAANGTGPLSLLHGQLPASAATAVTPVAAALPARLQPLEAGDGEQAVVAPTAGRVVEVSVKTGDRVETGDTLVVMSAMKMETVVVAPARASSPHYWG